ncbi:hypothetical protein LSUE1_G003808 [Lachnellula suecica]|uniref:AB hydrolase-1 domain-containing protein n=1 Tax=Lachnellula suecica TaxID=602035 RepID=A0A8T9CDM6_9HELO|nr:hypothetical protein LSUE1_G003808 [Lachnellula suecica]
MRFNNIFKALCLDALIPLCTSTPLAKREPSCTDIVIPVTITANNVDLTSTQVPQPIVIVTGTYNIAGRYCEPENQISGHHDTLQVLVHGISYTRDYWSGDGPPGQGFHVDQYSWVSTASEAGYPTLAIDRLGNGISDHPDPLQIVQTPAEVEVLHQIIAQAKSGASPLPRAFDKIILAGHSYGSVVANVLVAEYPDNVNALILTGYSSTYNFVIPGMDFSSIIAPAATEDPGRFESLASEYLELTSQPGFDLMFYFPGGYDPQLEAQDFAQRGTFTTGELSTAGNTGSIASGYKGPVFVVTGQHDACFCNPQGLPSDEIDCTSFLADTQELFPAASSFDAYIVPDSGHCWQLHFAATTAFAVVQTWIEAHGF